MVYFVWIVLLLASLSTVARADWPTLRGNSARTGFVDAHLQPPFQLIWARDFAQERLGTAMEPIVAGGRLFATTHNGSVYALDTSSGKPLWRFQAHGPFLHSPAVQNQVVVAASADGNLYALRIEDGKLTWRFAGPLGGFSASPAIAEGKIYIGSRSGDFFAVEAESGKVVWKQSLDIPIRQTAAVAAGKVFITGEDLKVRCFNASSGQLLWTSEQLVGQTARDYYPVVVNAGTKPLSSSALIQF